MCIYYILCMYMYVKLYYSFDLDYLLALALIIMI